MISRHRLAAAAVLAMISAAALAAPADNTAPSYKPTNGTPGSVSGTVLQQSDDGYNSKPVNSAHPLPITGTVTSTPSGTQTVQGASSDNTTNSTAKVPTIGGRANAADPAWTEGRMVPVSTDLAGYQRVTAKQNGTWTVTQGTSPWVTNDPGLPDTLGQKTMANSTGVAISSDQSSIPVKGATASGSPIVDPPVPIGGSDGTNVRTIRTATDGTLLGASGAIAGTDASSNTITTNVDSAGTALRFFVRPELYNGASADRQKSAGVGNNVAATGLAASSPYVQYNASLPSLTTGNYAAAQADSSARQIIVGAGTAGTPGGGLLSVQGVSGGTAQKVSSAPCTVDVETGSVAVDTTQEAATTSLRICSYTVTESAGTAAVATVVLRHDTVATTCDGPAIAIIELDPNQSVTNTFGDRGLAVPNGLCWDVLAGSINGNVSFVVEAAP